MLQEVFLREFKQALAWEGKQCWIFTKREKWEVHCALHVPWGTQLLKYNLLSWCPWEKLIHSCLHCKSHLICRAAWLALQEERDLGSAWPWEETWAGMESAVECPAPSVLPAAGAGLRSALRNSWISYPQNAVKRLQMTVKHFVFQEMSITGISQKYFFGT